jgi:hypothetical protein
MKKTLIIAFLIVAGLSKAQNDLYQKVSSFLKQNDPSLIVQSKILVINFVDPGQNGDKSVYKSLEKAGDVYAFAKLKGGRNGVICVTVVKDSKTEIALNKQGYTHIHVLNAEQLGNLDTTGIDNITFNAMGEMVYKNLESDKIYEAINQLITR